MSTPQIAAQTPRADRPPLPPCPLLVPERPLLLMPRLATLIGLDRALVLQQVRCWLEKLLHLPGGMAAGAGAVTPVVVGVRQ